MFYYIIILYRVHSKLLLLTSVHFYFTCSHRLTYFTSLVRQTSQYGKLAFTYGRLVLLHLSRLALDICLRTVDSHILLHLFVRHLFTIWQTRIYLWQTRFTSLGQTRIRHLYTYGRLFCSLLVLAYFTSLGQTLIRHLFTIWQFALHTCSHIFYFTWVDSDLTSVHNMVDLLLFTLVLAYFTSLGQTLIRHLFTISVQYGIRHLLCPECRQVAFLVSSLQVLIGLTP